MSEEMVNEAMNEMLNETPNQSWKGRRITSKTRRDFLARLGYLALGGTAVGLGIGSLPGRAGAAVDEPIPTKLLLRSDFVYISPLLSSGEESTCHGELWFAWIDDSVVVNVASDRWKAKALARGLDQARIWVGNHGRWKGVISRNEAFRKAPHFDARVDRVDDSKMVDRLLTVYEEKYPEEIASWRDTMRTGVADGSRVLLRYRPIPPTKS